LRTAEDISGLLQKCHFALRKPPFYPLNYGDAFQRTEVSSQRSDIRRLREKIQKSDVPPSSDSGVARRDQKSISDFGLAIVDLTPR